MSDYLSMVAQRDVWCTPEMDRQVIFGVKRITAPVGVKGYIDAMWTRLPLPDAVNRFHVFQIGQVHPLLIGLCQVRRTWYRLSTAMERGNLFADVYHSNGRQLPRTETWVLYTEDRAVIIAIADQPSIPSIRHEDVYLRLYSNAFFSSDRADGFAHRIQVSGRRYTTLSDALQFQQEYNAQRQQPGQTSLYINGQFQLTFLPQQLRQGDQMEYVYDSTVKQVLEFDLIDAPEFDSLRDLKRKLLLTHGGDQIGGPVIDYRDDIDVYLVRKELQGSQHQRRGFLFHKNRDDAFRMVTHRDYSVAVQYLQAYLDDHPSLGNLNELSIRLHVRHSGYHRPLVFESNRIHELYKLPFVKRRMAMHGADAGVEVWQVANLENSEYCRSMDAYYGQIDRTRALDLFGYNATARITADSPLLVDRSTGVGEVKLPYGLRFGCTVFEYDGTGLLLGFFYYAGGGVYRPYHSNCAMVEAHVGRGGYRINALFGQDGTVREGVSYRCYLAPINSQGVMHDHWMDVTGDDTRYVEVDGRIAWTVDGNYYATCIRYDDEFLAYRLQLSPRDGLLRFSIDGTAVYPNGSQQGIMYIPVGKLDIWLNGHSLVENLDYFVRWPEVVIVNKEYLNDGDDQEIVIRGYGFCNRDMSRENPPDVGYVRHGALSRNSRFNVRDDRVMRMVVRGRVRHRDELSFSEDNPALHLDDVSNGSPYVIDNIPVPLRELDGRDFFDYRNSSLAVDKAIEDYLTVHIPEPQPVQPNMVPDKYRVYSPFSSVITHHLVSGFISMEKFRGQYSDQDVIEELSGYVWLLDYEPTRAGLDPDLISIHAHNKRSPVVLDIYQRNFLARAVRAFLDNKVDLAAFIEVDNTIG